MRYNENGSPTGGQAFWWERGLVESFHALPPKCPACERTQNAKDIREETINEYGGLEEERKAKVEAQHVKAGEAEGEAINTRGHALPALPGDTSAR